MGNYKQSRELRVKMSVAETTARIAQTFLPTYLAETTSQIFGSVF